MDKSDRANNLTVIFWVKENMSKPKSKEIPENILKMRTKHKEIDQIEHCNGINAWLLKRKSETDKTLPKIVKEEKIQFKFIVKLWSCYSKYGYF